MDTYQFIDAVLEQLDITDIQPPTIPRLQFVETALALGHQSGSTSISTLPVFMVEEKINGSWQKYLHNGSARIPSHLSEKDTILAEFLAFTQHVQYLRTNGLAFISDYQGVSSHIRVHIF